MASAVLKRPLCATTTETIEAHPIPPKRIRLQPNIATRGQRKPWPIVQNLEGINELSDKELLNVLIKITDGILLKNAQENDVTLAVEKLSELYREKLDSDTMVRTMILRIMADLSQIQNAEIIQKILHEIISLLKQEKKQSVVANGLSCLYNVGQNGNVGLMTMATSANVAYYAQQQLSSESFETQKKALMVLAYYVALGDAKKGIIELIAQYADSPDARVRAQALNALICLSQRGVGLAPSLYQYALVGMRDDYDCVRKEALQLIFEVGIANPDYMIPSGKAAIHDDMRLIDAAFSKVCEALCDLSIQIRTQAATHLGQMHQVSPEFLHQTLDKKLMSNLRRKKTAHERGAQLVTSGEWSSGKRWGDDAPQEQVDTTSVSLIASGACGALVHGLEDEFLEVRTAAVESMCRLSLFHPDFATTSLDFLVDMFNDEIEDVRLKAIYSLTAISKHIVLREDQLEIMLSSLEDYSVEVREGLHLMLGACRVSTQACLLMVVQKVLDVLSKYPQDKHSAFACLRKVGQKHANLCMAITTHLLQDHPLFDSPERDVDDPAYLCILILLFNAAEQLTPIISLFPHIISEHYVYLRDAMPNYVPALPIEGASTNKRVDLVAVSNSSIEYLNSVREHIDEIYEIANDRLPLLKTAHDNLMRFGEIDQDMFGCANFISTFLATLIQMEQLQSQGPSHHRAPQKDMLTQLVRHCYKFQNFFSGLSYEDSLLVKQTCLRASALYLIHIVRDSTQSALAPCQMLLQIAFDLSNFIDYDAPFQPDNFTLQMLSVLARLPDPKPGRVFREILPLLDGPPRMRLPPPNNNIRMCVATIIEPSAQMAQENIIKVTAGLIAEVPFVAEFENLQEAQKQNMRIKVKYPDQNVHTVTPKLSDFRAIMTDHGLSETNVRLRTQILLSHNVWTEACTVELTLCLIVRPGMDLELCKPAKLLFAPKPVRRGI